jgi:hypothetical protein
MARIKAILEAWLADVTEARASADRISAKLSERYGNDPILKFFPVPRAEIEELRVEMKFLVDKATADEVSIVVDSKTLDSARPETLCTATFVIRVGTCRWTHTDGSRILVVDE